MLVPFLLGILELCCEGLDHSLRELGTSHLIYHCSDSTKLSAYLPEFQLYKGELHYLRVKRTYVYRRHGTVDVELVG